MALEVVTLIGGKLELISKRIVNAYIKENKQIFYIESILLLLSIFILFNSSILNSIYQFVIIVVFLVLFIKDIISRIILNSKLNSLLIINTRFNEKDLLKTLNLPTFISGEITDFIILTMRLMLINISLKKEEINFEKIYEDFLIIQIILEKSKDWNKDIELTIYDLRFNNKLFLLILMKYKYSNQYAFKIINMLLVDEKINYNYLNKEGMSKEDIDFCLKRIQSEDSK